jgi:hypothetical protein
MAQAKLKYRIASLRRFRLSLLLIESSSSRLTKLASPISPTSNERSLESSSRLSSGWCSSSDFGWMPLPLTRVGAITKTVSVQLLSNNTPEHYHAGGRGAQVRQRVENIEGLKLEMENSPIVADGMTLSRASSISYAIVRINNTTLEKEVPTRGRKRQNQFLLIRK